MWFKRDFRVSDHEPLLKASENGQVVPLYIAEPDLWQLPDSSYRHWSFIHDSITELQSKLLALGTPLIIRVGEATTVLNILKSELKHFKLWSHEETGNNWTYQRDLKVKKWCEENHILWNETSTNGIVRRGNFVF